MHDKAKHLKKLFDDKKYSEVLVVIENEIYKDNLNSGLLNLSGVCRLLLSKSKDSLKKSIQDFRKAYLIEKTTPNALEALKNYINVSMDLFDIEFKSNDNQFFDNVFDEILFYFEERKELIEDNESFYKAMIRVFKRRLDVDNVIYYLNKLSKRNDPDSICSLIYFNSFKKNWEQRDFFEKSKLLRESLLRLPVTDLVNIKVGFQKKINIAFVTSDIRGSHSVTYFLKTVLRNYDKERFNIILIINNINQDETSIHFSQYVNKTINIFGLKDLEAINIIREHQIDIIFDMMGFTSDHRLSLFRNRLAQIQISWCGYCNTTGIEEMDYLIADPNLILKDEQNLYTEKIIYLPEIWNCHSGINIKRKEYTAPLLDNKFITFGSFNNFRKINDDVIGVWSEILKKIPYSKLILKASDSASNKILCDKFKKLGVLKSIDFISFKNNFKDHLKEYQKIDLALDTFPYNGVTTSFEAIWMGVPVLTIKGYNFNSRCGESINQNLNIKNLIADDQKDYIEKAYYFSKNSEDLIKLRKKIFNKASSSPLFNVKKFSNDFYCTLEKLIK